MDVNISDSFLKPICCTPLLSSSQNATPDSFHFLAYSKYLHPLFLSSVSRSLALSISPNFLPAHFLPSRPLPLLSLSHHFSNCFRGRLSFFLWFSHASAGYEGIVLCIWENRKRERGRDVKAMVIKRVMFTGSL